MNTIISGFLISLLAAGGLISALPVRANYAEVPDVGNAGGADIVAQELRWPYWNGGYYNTWTDSSFTSSDGVGGSFYSGVPLPATGSATQTNGVFTVQGAGNLSGTADNFRFVYQNMSGDAEIRARIPSYQNTGANGRVGVMMRDSLTANSMNAFMGIQVTNGTFYFQTRTSSGGATTSTSSGTGTAPNIWVRLVRSGTTLSGYKSGDGATWTLVSTNTFTMSTNCYFGLGVASGTTNTLNTATFDNLTVTP